MTASIRRWLLIGVLGATVLAVQSAPASAQAAPGRITFLAATCPASSSMYTRVAAGEDPNSGENGTPADPTDIAAYGCSPTSGMSAYLIANSTANSVFTDETMQSSATISTSEAGPAGGATLFPAGSTVYVPGGVAQARRFSVANYPTTITARAAMPFLDLQCLSDGYNSDNADGAGWDDQAIASGAQAYCIAYIWDGIAAATPTASPTVAPAVAPTATPTSTSPTATVTVSFQGLSSVHTYVHANDGAAGSAGGAQVSSSTWKTDGTTLTVNKGTYDIRVVHGPTTVVLDAVNCSSDCTVNVPLTTLTVNFPGLSDVHSYAHKSDGAPGSVGAEDSSSTWKANSTGIVLLQGVYDVRVVHGPMASVFDDVDCRSASCTVNVPLATLTVNFPGMSEVHSYAHRSDGAVGTYGAEDSSSTWKSNSTSMVILHGVYDVRVVHGPMASVFDEVDCRGATCSVTVPTATLTVNFPGMANVHSYAHRSDGAAGTFGPEDSSSTWKSNTTSMTILQGVYDVRVVHGPMALVFDGIDCRAATCSVDVPLATLTVNFPGMANVHSYAHKSDGAAGTYGVEDSSATWKSNTTSMVILQGVYDVRVVHGPMALVFDSIDCRAAACSVDVPMATLTVNFPGMANMHSYAHKSDGAAGSYGSEDSSSTWKTDTTSMVLLQGVYDVRVVHGPMASVFDNVDCRSATCVVDVPLAQMTVTFPGHSNVHTYVKANDNVSGTATGAEDSSSTWKTNGTSFVLLRGVYDVLLNEGNSAYVVDAVDCRSATCQVAMPVVAATLTPSPTATPTNTPTPSVTATPATKEPAPVAVKKTFVSADDSTVTWRIEPSSSADLLVWDASAEGCEAFGGADCGGIGKGDYGKFTASVKTGQYLLVAQSYKKDGDACEVTNVAEWSKSLDEKPESVTATYKCSGASTMGWILFGMFAFVTVGLAWTVQRKAQWSH